MATTMRSPASAARNGAGDVAEKAKDAAQRSRGPALAAGAAAAGLAGGLLLGARLRRPPLAMRALAGVQRAAVAAGRASTAVDDLHAVREQLDAMNRRSPIEVVLDGLTHRRGAHKREG